jgi:hypothetical protein
MVVIIGRFCLISGLSQPFEFPIGHHIYVIEIAIDRGKVLTYVDDWQNTQLHL